MTYITEKKYSSYTLMRNTFFSLALLNYSISKMIFNIAFSTNEPYLKARIQLPILGRIKISTRLFRDFPSVVLLDATGWNSPNPLALNHLGSNL